MYSDKQKKHTIDILFVLILFGVFAISALMLVIMGSTVYSKTVDSMETNFNDRTSYAYITEKFRQNDSINSISIEQVNDNSSFVFSKEINNESYQTYLYIHDGYLKELFVKKGETLPLKAGNIILEADSMEITKIDTQTFQCTVKKDGSYTFFLLTANTEQK